MILANIWSINVSQLSRKEEQHPACNAQHGQNARTVHKKTPKKRLVEEWQIEARALCLIHERRASYKRNCVRNGINKFDDAAERRIDPKITVGCWVCVRLCWRKRAFV